jgi:DNA-binding MurR/RpiR family transcriptional regulator
MSVQRQLKTVYNTLKPVQRKIADYFLSADFESLDSSIEDVAYRSGTSVASISRFCKWLGYDSFGQFKITLSRDLKYEPDTVLPIFQMDDDPELIIRKVFSEAVTNLQATEGVVEFRAIKRAAERIIKRRNVYFFGLGGSGKVGSFGEVWFSHIGYNARAIIDPYEMIVKAGYADGGYNIVGLSHSGATKPVVEATEVAKYNGAFTIGITNYDRSPLARMVDVLLLTACPERRVHFAQSNSMVAQSTILRALYILAASKSRGLVEDRVNSIEKNVNYRLRKKLK